MFPFSRQSRTPAQTRCSPSHQETGTSRRSWLIMRTASWCERQHRTNVEYCPSSLWCNSSLPVFSLDISWAQRTVQSGDICTGNVCFCSWHGDIFLELKLSLPSPAATAPTLLDLSTAAVCPALCLTAAATSAAPSATTWATSCSTAKVWKLGSV